MNYNDDKPSYGKYYKPKGKRCQECGNEFVESAPTQKFCHNPCGSKEWRAERDKKISRIGYG